MSAKGERVALNTLRDRLGLEEDICKKLDMFNCSGFMSLHLTPLGKVIAISSLQANDQINGSMDELL
ncbi:MAG: hypothetical protein RIC29_17905 [Rhodospirillaceae bacterium]